MHRLAYNGSVVALTHQQLSRSGRFIQIDRGCQVREESDSNHDTPASSRRQSVLERSFHFPLPPLPDNLPRNSNN